MIDIQRQLKGLPVAEEKERKAEDYIFAERVRVIDTLFTFATDSPEEERQRRVAAISAPPYIGYRKAEASAAERTLVP